MHGTYTFGLAHSQGMETAVCSLLWYCCGRGIQRRSQKLSPGPISTTGTAESEWDNRITQQRCLIEQELGEHRKTSYNTAKQCNLLLVVRGMLLLWVHENIQMIQCVEQARKRHGCLSVASWLSVATMPPSEARPISGEQVLLGMHNTLLSKCRVTPFPFPTNWPIKAFLNLGKKSCKRNLYFTTVSFPQASQRLKRKRQYKAGQRLFTWKHTAWK